MRKLRLDSLQVDSFATTSGISGVRGTVEGHLLEAEIPGIPSTSAGPWTYDARECGETQYFDCTFGCSQMSRCDRVCYLEPKEPK